MPRRTLRKNVGETRRFVEEFFGRGSASSKVTVNPNTIERALEKYMREHKIRREPFPVETASGISVNLGAKGSKGTKNIIYFDTKSKRSGETSVHEHAHAAYDRIRRREGKRSMALISEALSSSLALEWSLRQNKNMYRVYLLFFKKQYDKLLKGKLKHTKTFRSKVITNSSAGEAFAYRIHTKFFDMPEVRRKLMRELMEKEFTTYKQVLDWIEKYGTEK